MHVRYETPGPERAESLLLHVAIAFEGYRSFAPEGWQPPDELTPDNVERVRAELADTGSFALMALYHDDPVGHVLWIAREDHLHLRHLFVLEPWWGGGVARTLHARAVEAARGRPMRLLTPAAHLRARRFYEREGWELHAERPEPKLGLDVAEYRRG